MSRTSPKLWKGCLVALPPIGLGVTWGNVIPRLVIFQFNPESLDHSLEASITEKPPIQFKDLPKEEVTFTAHFDAADYMADKEAIAAGIGISPQLSALELMLYPGVGSIIQGMIGAQAGMVEISETSVPLTLFIWGGKWIVPVQITKLTIHEKAFNTTLAPIRAEAEISLKILSYGDFPNYKNAGFWIFLTHHLYKEGLSLLNIGDQMHHIVKYYK